MLHSKIAKWLVTVVLCILMVACVSTTKTSNVSDKENSALYLKMGKRYLGMNRLEIAKEKLERAIALDSNNAGAYNTLGALYERLKQNDIAGVQYKKAIKLNPDNPSIQNNYGHFLCGRGKHKEGLELLNKALLMPFNSRKWFAHTNIGLCELGQGHQELAENSFRQALQENNRYSPALIEMQKISYQTKKHMSARAFFLRYLTVAKASAETLWYAVQTEQALGNRGMSDKYATQLLTQFPTSKEAQQLKAEAK